MDDLNENRSVLNTLPIAMLPSFAIIYASKYFNLQADDSNAYN